MACINILKNCSNDAKESKLTSRQGLYTKMYLESFKRIPLWNLKLLGLDTQTLDLVVIYEDCSNYDHEFKHLVEQYDASWLFWKCFVKIYISFVSFILRICELIRIYIVLKHQFHWSPFLFFVNAKYIE